MSIPFGIILQSLLFLGVAIGTGTYHPATMIRITLPFHLQNLAQIEGDIALDLDGDASPTVGGVLDALESKHPVLRGTIREHGTLKRRPFIRYFACGRDLSHEPPETPLPEKVASGDEPFMVIGAIAGG